MLGRRVEQMFTGPGEVVVSARQAPSLCRYSVAARTGGLRTGRQWPDDDQNAPLHESRGGTEARGTWAGRAAVELVRLDRQPRVSAGKVSPAAQRVLGVAGLLVVLQLVLRTWVAARGNFYWDDLILTGRSGSMPLLSTEFLLHDHDGHFMPAAFLVAGLVTKAAPLQW